MSVQERRAEEIAQMQARILRAARELAQEKGWPEVTIRAIGQRIRYSAPLIYTYFKGKEALLQEICKRGQTELTERFEKVLRKGVSGRAISQLTDLSLCQYAFATEQPEVYQVMYSLQGASVTLPEDAERVQPGSVVRQVIWSAISEATLSPNFNELEDRYWQWWSLVHGFISLVMQRKNGDFAGQQARFEQLTSSFVRHLMIG